MGYKIIILALSALMCIFFLPACQHTNREAAGKKISVPDQSIHSNGDIKAKDIIIYGSKTCPHCMAFIQKIDREGILYTFKEVDNDDENYQEMFNKIKSINFHGYVNYPVLDVGGKILVAPSYDKFYSIYSR